LSTTSQIGSFMNNGDKRNNHTVHRFDHQHVRNISMSFDPATLRCTSCSNGHTVLHREVEGLDIGLCNPQLFVLTDQNFSPKLPVEGEGECVKVVMVENCTITDLVDVFLGITKGSELPAGTVVLLASASHAAAVGMADYAADFVRGATRLGKTFTRGVHVIHGIPLLIGGTANTPAIRAIAEIEQWITQTSAGTGSINTTRALFAGSIRTSKTCLISNRSLDYQSASSALRNALSSLRILVT
jgi:hypothetical protein